MIIDEGKIFISNDNGENYLHVLEIFLLITMRNKDRNVFRILEDLFSSEWKS